jgi:hypothetical protein
MRFKQFVEELQFTSIETGQAEKAHEPTGEDRIEIDNPKISMEMNSRLMNDLYQPFLSPESGIQAIRKVLHRFGFDLPALYNADPEGDEFVIDIEQFGQENLSTNLYVIYYLTDEGGYDFYAEIGNESRMEELLSDDRDLEEIEN